MSAARCSRRVSSAAILFASAKSCPPRAVLFKLPPRKASLTLLPSLTTFNAPGPSQVDGSVATLRVASTIPD